jgi:Zn-dependent protease
LLDIDVATLIIAFIVLLFSLTVHEAAHAWSADRLGDPTARLLGRVSLNPIVHADPIGTVLFPLIGMLTPNVPLIGWAKPVPVDVRRLRRQYRDYVLVAAAGPASNLVLASGAALGLQAFSVAPLTVGEANMTAPLAAFLTRAVYTNVLLAVFNMLPIPPLDGGNVLMGVLPETMARVVDLLRPWGFLILYALLFTGALGSIVLPIADRIIEFLVL